MPTGPGKRRRLLDGRVFAPLGRGFPAFAEGNATFHARMYLAEILVRPRLCRAIGRSCWKTLWEGVREGLSWIQRLGAECPSGTSCEHGMLRGALVNPPDRSPWLDDELGRL